MAHAITGEETDSLPPSRLRKGPSWESWSSLQTHPFQQGEHRGRGWGGNPIPLAQCPLGTEAQSKSKTWFWALCSLRNDTLGVTSYTSWGQWCIFDKFYQIPNPAGSDAHPWQGIDSHLPPVPPVLFLPWPCMTLSQAPSTSWSHLTRGQTSRDLPVWGPIVIDSLGLMEGKKKKEIDFGEINNLVAITMLDTSIKIKPENSSKSGSRWETPN